ncbi:hypothetical protein C8J57DRAFT_1514790 [Mycena rebaudengoi]|nr:hypothetical protein C8J57DRAFT_1514790 [Mycena rebaudengoi]
MCELLSYLSAEQPPYSMKLTVTQAIWGKSSDVCLQARGDYTNIDYEALFKEYLDILLTGLRNNIPSILNVFAKWDRIVFPHSDVHAGKSKIFSCERCRQ